MDNYLTCRHVISKLMLGRVGIMENALSTRMRIRGKGASGEIHIVLCPITLTDVGEEKVNKWHSQ